MAQFKNLLSTEEVGAFIYEPLVQAAAGMRMYAPEFLDALILEAKKHEVVCIADEVFTGFGRTGKMFASNYLTNDPDIIAVSKGITGGSMALGVTSCCEKVVSAFRSNKNEKTFFHGHSYTANPIACAAANASFELLVRKNCQDQISMIERQHMAFKQEIEGTGNVQEIRCRGTILAVELKTQEETSYFNEVRKKILGYFLSRNILLRPLGNVIYIVPPYVIQQHELNQIYSCIENFLREIER